MNGAQLLEKNHFLAPQNRVTSAAMPSTHAKDMFREKSRRRARLVLLLMAAIIAAATLAPMAVLAG